MSVMDEKIVEAMALAMYERCGNDLLPKQDHAFPLPGWEKLDFRIKDHIRVQACAAWDAAKAALAEAGMVIVLQKPIREECCYCKKQCDSLAGNPGLWPLHLPLDSARPGQCVAVHNRCVLDRLREASAASGQN